MSGSAEMYFGQSERERLLRQHDFYLSQVRSRLISQFSNIQNEAEAFADTEYKRLGSQPSSDGWDMSEAAEWAYDASIDFYMMLEDMRDRTILGALAGIYHQWEQDLREHLERELRRLVAIDDAHKLAWRSSVPEILDFLAKLGWDCREQAFGSRVTAAGLIVNVYKHGKGRSLDAVDREFGEYIDRPLKGFPFFTRETQPEWVRLTEAQLCDVAGGLREFWVHFPERLSLPS